MNRTRKYLKRIQGKIFKLLKTPSKSYTKETFHELRVEIKKWEALCHLLAFLTPKFNRKKTIKPIAGLFKQAGKVREIQIELDLLQDFFPLRLERYQKKQLKKLNKQEKKFARLISQKKLLSDIKDAIKYIKKLLYIVRKRGMVKYTLTQKKKVKKLIDKPVLNPARIHFLRKRLKRWEYNNKILLKKKRQSEVFCVPTEVLGTWHDGQVVEDCLQKVLDAQNTSSVERTELTNVLAQLNIQNQELLEKVKVEIANCKFT